MIQTGNESKLPSEYRSLDLGLTDEQYFQFIYLMSERWVRLPSQLQRYIRFVRRVEPRMPMEFIIADYLVGATDLCNVSLAEQFSEKLEEDEFIAKIMHPGISFLSRDELGTRVQYYHFQVIRSGSSQMSSVARRASASGGIFVEFMIEGIPEVGDTVKFHWPQGHFLCTIEAVKIELGLRRTRS